jgi:aspartate aminotransferase-like enzyme
VSEAAWERVEATEARGLYADLEPWRDVETTGEFPYTHLVSNCYGLAEAVSMLLDEGLEAVYSRHEASAKRCRELGAEIGLDTDAEEPLCSPTVTAFEVDGALAIQRELQAEHDVLVGTGLTDRENDLVRVGHIGYNADVERVERTMDALEDVLDGSDDSGTGH